MQVANGGWAGHLAGIAAAQAAAAAQVAGWTAVGIPWWNGPAGWHVPVPVVGLNPPQHAGPQYVYHSVPEHFAKMLARWRHVRGGGRPDVYWFALLCLTLNKNANARSNPHLWTTAHMDTAQRRCYDRHYDELQASGYMTTFEIDT